MNMPSECNAESICITFSEKVDHQGKNLISDQLNKITGFYSSKCSRKKKIMPHLYKVDICFLLREAEFSIKVSKKKSETRREIETHPGILSRMRS